MCIGCSYARLRDISFHGRGDVVADIDGQGVVLAVPGLLLLHVAERTRADPDLGQKKSSLGRNVDF